MNDLVSFCIPVYNGEKYIFQCIESLLKQTYKNIEIVVVDDASIDGTASIIHNIKDNRIRYYRNTKNLGWRNTVKVCYGFATGDFVSIIPVDDFPKEKFAETAVINFNLNENLAVWSCEATTINEKKEFISVKQHFALDKLIKSKDYFNLLYTQKYVSPPAESMLRMKCFRKINGDELYNDEYKQFPEIRVYLKMADKGGDFYYTATNLCNRTSRSDSLTALYGTMAFAIQDNINIFNEFFEYKQLKKESKEESLKTIYKKIFRGFILNFRNLKIKELFEYRKLIKKNKTSSNPHRPNYFSINTSYLNLFSYMLNYYFKKTIRFLI